MDGKLITIEGTEGAGKSSAIAFINHFLSERQCPVRLTREPGGTAIGEAIRHILLHTPKGEMLFPQTELLLMFAARQQHIREIVLPALQAGLWVVSDRYVDASYAYQGGGRSLDPAVIQYLDEWIVANTQPDLTILFDLPVEQGLQRAAARGAGQDRIEQEKIDFFERVRKAYLARAALFPKRIQVIDASLPEAAVQAQLETVLQVFWERVRS